MKLDPVYTISFLVVTLLMIHFFIKRLSGKKGCMTYGYIGLILFCINVFAIFSWVFMYSSTKDLYAIATSGQQYTATVISFTEEQHYDSEDNRYYTMYQPTVEFTTEAGNVIAKELDFSTSGLEVGDTYKVNYNEANDKVITLGFTLVMKLVGSFIFCFIFTLLLVGVIKFSSGHSMESYKAFASKIGFQFFIPFLMIGFNLLLIYGIFYGNEVPLFVTGLLIFFSVMLALGTLGYLKMIFTKGEPKMKRVGVNKWAGDWESDEAEEKYYQERYEKEKKRKNKRL